MRRAVDESGEDYLYPCAWFIDLRLPQLPGTRHPRSDPTRFAEAFVELGTVCWPNVLDLAPELLYERVSGRPLSGSARRRGNHSTSTTLRIKCCSALRSQRHRYRPLDELVDLEGLPADAMGFARQRL